MRSRTLNEAVGVSEPQGGSHRGRLLLCAPAPDQPPLLEDQLESLKASQAMDESDDDFRELCASFFQRVKKTAIKEVSGDKTLKGRSGTRINKLKKTKPTVPKTKTLPGPGEKKPHSGNQAPGAETRRETTEQQSELAVAANGEGDVLAPGADQPGLCERAQDTPTGKPTRATFAGRKPGAGELWKQPGSECWPWVGHPASSASGPYSHPSVGGKYQREKITALNRHRLFSLSSSK